MCGETGEEVLIKVTVIREFRITEKRSRMKTYFLSNCLIFVQNTVQLDKKKNALDERGLYEIL